MSETDTLREQAAKIADDHGETWGLAYKSMTDTIAAAIRAMPLPAPVALPQAGEEGTPTDDDRLDRALTLLDMAGKHIVDSDVWTSIHEQAVKLRDANPTAAAPDDGLMGRYRDDFQRIIEECEAGRWSNAIDIALAALSTATGDEAQQGDG